MAGKKKVRTNINLDGAISSMGGAGKNLAASSNVHLGEAVRQAAKQTARGTHPSEALSRADSDAYATIAGEGGGFASQRKTARKKVKSYKKKAKGLRGAQLKSDVTSVIR